MNRRSFLLGSLVLAGCGGGGQSVVEKRTRVACVGDSITFGVGATTPYPGLLQLKHSEWEVANFGHSGDRVADVSKRLQSILDWKPDLITLMIGTNNARDQQARVDFLHDYDKLVDGLWGGYTRITNGVLATIPPLRSIGENYFAHVYSDMIQTALATATCDVNKALTDQPVFDGNEYHPNQHGHDLMAQCFETAILAVLK